MTASVLPCVGRTAPSASGIQSICAFMMPVIAPWRSGEHQTMPSDHVDESRSSCTFGWSAGASSGSGRPRGIEDARLARRSRRRMRAASSEASRLNERSRSEP